MGGAEGGDRPSGSGPLSGVGGWYAAVEVLDTVDGKLNRIRVVTRRMHFWVPDWILRAAAGSPVLLAESPVLLVGSPVLSVGSRAES